MKPIVFFILGILTGALLILAGSSFRSQYRLRIQPPVWIEQRVKPVLTQVPIVRKPTSTPRPTPTPAVDASVTRYLYTVFKAQAKTAYAVSKAASGYRCDYAKDGRYGLFAIHESLQGYFQGKPMRDCRANIDAAYRIYRDYGWKAWPEYPTIAPGLL